MQNLITVEADGTMSLTNDKSIKFKGLPTAVWAALWKLKDYESSGLTPDQVDCMKYELDDYRADNIGRKRERKWKK